MQSFDDLEAIIVDDASTDQTLRVVEALSDPRVRYIRHSENLGPAAALNTGLELARGEYLACLDADDLMKSNNLAAKVAMLDGERDVGLVYSNAEIIDAHERSVGSLYRARDTREPRLNHVFNQLLNENFIVASSTVVRRSCYDVVGLYDVKLRHGEDWDMWLRLADRYPFGYIDEQLIQHRVHPDSLQYRNLANNQDLVANDKIIKRSFETFELEKRGFSEDAVRRQWFFRLLANKHVALALPEVMRLYRTEIADHPRYLLTSENAVFLAKTAGYGILSKAAISRIKARRYRAGVHHPRL